MTWQEIGHDGRPRYIKGNDRFCYLTRNRRGALDDIPEGWEVYRDKNNVLRLRKK